MNNNPRVPALNRQPSCVVGIGASAGGLEALQQFLTFLPSNTGMAFVIIQHLAPDHKSLLAEILGKYSALPVTEIQDGMQVEANHVYMIPPKYNVEIHAGTLRLSEYNPQKINHPIDVFFRSLAMDYENRAVAVILSGTGADGTNGIRSIKEQNGVIIVQSPESAKFDGMPRNAIATGFADLIQKPDAIARELGHIAASMMTAGAHLQFSDQDLLTQVFSILKSVTNINYVYYKQTTILRRIERRLVVTHNRNLQEYVKYLRENMDEAKTLAKEVLIGVTSFFRDPEYFEVFKELVVRQLVKNAPKGKQIRVWVAGCSTGEEAYSIAILFAEVMEELNIQREIKIFATDLDSESIAVAARGSYGDNIIEDVSVTRLSKYFTRKGNKYIIHQDIRKMIIFAQHNVFQDPPFGKQDLISCRNVLIYFQTVLQRNLFSIFHMALNDHGYLFLGRSESVIDYDDIFRVISANEKIFVHNSLGHAPSHEHFGYSMQGVESMLQPLSIEKIEDDADVQYKANELNFSILEQLMPACVLVDEKNELFRSFGDCSRFLSIPTGAATLDIFQLLRSDLRIAVSTVLRDSRTSNETVSYDSVPVQIEGNPEYISIVAQPIHDHQGAKTKYTSISFLRGKRDLAGNIKHYQIDTAAAQRISNLEQELKLTKGSLRQTVTELESVNAELQAANEELLTANEELQSSNEELQSVNEELYTVNSEYQSKVTELATVNDDMANFLATTLVGILMVDRNLNIRKYTEYVASEFSVADQDVGRSLRYINYNFEGTDLIEDCRQVLENMEPMEKNCVSVSGKTYMVRIAPYRQTQSLPIGEEYSGHGETYSAGSQAVKGLVLTFVDTTKQINDQEQMEEMANALRLAVESGKEKETFLSHMSHDMRTPMTTIFGLTHLILQEEEISDSVRENLEKIQSSSKYMLSLIEEILETSRINAGKIVSVSYPVEEDNVLNSVASIAMEQAREKHITFNVTSTGSKGRYVLMDTPHVERVLLNLLSNSLKYTLPGGKIDLKEEVTYHGALAEHVYRITDNGCGISEEFQNRMFKPFEQDHNENYVQEGTGLGLYIVKNLIDLLDGKITWKSKVNEGTTFCVTLTFPIATPEQVAMSKKRSETYEDKILAGKRVLLAEDNPINAEVIAKILNSKGIYTEIASDGEEALEMYRSHDAYHYQAILMDLMMPILSGEEAVKAIRGITDHEDSATIPIIAVTADLTANTPDRLRAAGIDAFVSKPIEPGKLFGILAKKFEKE